MTKKLAESIDASVKSSALVSEAAMVIIQNAQGHQFAEFDSHVQTARKQAEQWRVFDGRIRDAIFRIRDIATRLPDIDRKSKTLVRFLVKKSIERAGLVSAELHKLDTELAAYSKSVMATSQELAKDVQVAKAKAAELRSKEKAANAKIKQVREDDENFFKVVGKLLSHGLNAAAVIEEEMRELQSLARTSMTLSESRKRLLAMVAPIGNMSSSARLIAVNVAGIVVDWAIVQEDLKALEKEIESANDMSSVFLKSIAFKAVRDRLLGLAS